MWATEENFSIANPPKSYKISIFFLFTCFCFYLFVLVSTLHVEGFFSQISSIVPTIQDDIVSIKQQEAINMEQRSKQKDLEN